MKEYAVAKKFLERRSELRKHVAQHYSLEISIGGLDAPERFKVWNKATTSMGFLVKKNSDILSLLKVGDALKAKYYSTDSVNHSEFLETAIRHITKIDQGRLKGHYLVGLEVLRSQEPSGEFQQASEH